MFRKEDTSTETRVALYHPTNGVDVHSLVILQRQIPTSVVKTTLRTRHHSRMSTLASAPSLKIFLIAFLLMVNTVYSFRMGTVSRLSIQLHAVKSSSSDKIRVKLLADVKGTGRYHKIT